jgi:hypothetical protein
MRTFARYVYISILLVVSISAQEPARGQLSEVERVALKIGVLEQEVADTKRKLAEADSKIATLNQQILILTIQQEHGWKKGEMKFQLDPNGIPEAIPAPKTNP